MKNVISVKKKNKLGKRQNLLNRPHPTSPSSLSSTTSSGSEPEKTTIVYGEKKVPEKVLQFASGAGTEIKACIDQSRPLLTIGIPSLKRAFMDAKKRGVRLEYVTEITNKNISYCKKLIDIITELRHLEGIKGNFYVSDSGYLAPALFHEEGRVAAQAIYSNGKELVKHQRYVFDTLWGKAIPAGQKIREIEEGPSGATEHHYNSRIIEDQDEIIREISRLTAESKRLYTCISSGGLYYSYNHFFELKKILLEKQRKGAHEGVRYITNINKDNMELVRLLIDAGIQIRHVKNLPPMSFGVSEKETAATIEKMQGGKKLQSLLISNDPLYVTHFTSIFEELWKGGIDAPDRIMSIEEGSDTTNIEIIDNPREALRLAAEIVGSAKEEVLRIYPSVNAFRRQVRVGALDLFGKLMNRGVKVRMVIPSDDKELKSILDEVNEAGISPVLSSQLDIRSVDKSLQTHIGIIVVDRKESIIVESKDDTKDSYFEAAGLAAYSNSRQIALSYASIFESLWKQTEMYEQSRTYSRMQKEFINVAAHELRTPVQPIIGLADTLYSKAQDIRQKEALEIIIRNARRLQRLVEDILDVTKIESDSLNLNRERFNLEEVIEDAINDMSNSREFQFSGSSSRKRVKIVFDGTIRTKRHNGVIVAADKGRIYQVISNLLSNAVKFTEKGVIAVSVNTKRTNGNRSQQQEEVIVLIKDTGIGIHSEMVSRLFSKFASKSFEGTGLGLFISKRIIEAHGGRIWAVNNSDKDKEKAKGATFGFSLPLSLL